MILSDEHIEAERYALKHADADMGYAEIYQMLKYQQFSEEVADFTCRNLGREPETRRN